MIGKLKGVIDAYGEDFVIVDVQGVGYVVHCSARTLQNLPPAGEAAQLAIETHVREDMIRLYGDGSMRLYPQSSIATNHGAGTIYYDSDDNKLKVYNGTDWYTLDMTVVP